MSTFHSIEWKDSKLRLIDQRFLPLETKYNDYDNAQDVANAIRDMVTRGAPAIGASAAYGLALTAVHSLAKEAVTLRAELETDAEILRQSRPTAVNLFWAIDRVMNCAADLALDSADAIRTAVLDEAHAIYKEDIETNKAIGYNAMPFVPQGAKFLHHCNTGSLATVDYGTALGIIRIAHEEGKQIHAYLDETRPRLQGGRLSAWECKQLGIPHTLIVDGASGHLMRTIGIDLCVVGCDRVAANGDTANKIGTYNLALAARAHDVPFYVAAPTSTIDMTLANGDLIPIEERNAEEVTHVRECQITPDDTPVANFAFDVTPAKYITAIITEKGVVYPPFKGNLAKLLAED
ncbi:MAG: S-methyl-5-thioribose-1-phosphate isomerase [Chloroflexi bacterium]|nr:S-methyl-5-thioribose-1-phosphate isomerase [Chloroflexota bacterium]